MDTRLRARIEPLEMSFPFDFSDAIGKAKIARSPLAVWGGDGTIHFAAKELFARGCPVPLLALPGGSGNGLVRGLRTQTSPIRALENLLAGREILMDVGRLDGEPFFNLAGCGFEGDLAHEFHKSRGAMGFFSYAKVALKLWHRIEMLNAEWETTAPAPSEHGAETATNDHAPDYPSQIWSLCFANLPQYGGGLWIAPGADPTDGAIQLASLSKPELLDFVSGLPQLFRKNGKTRLRQECKVMKTTVRFGFPVNWQMDGEPALSRDRAEISVEPRAFRMMVAQGCPWI
jgi:diacylglycerol kinase family enzyme